MAHFFNLVLDLLDGLGLGEDLVLHDFQLLFLVVGEALLIDAIQIR